MKEPIVKIKLISGEPKIGEAKIIDGMVYVEVYIIGIKKDGVNIIADENSITIDIDNSSNHVKESKFSILSDVLDFMNFSYKNTNGILGLWIPIVEEDEVDKTPIKITI